MKRLDYKESCQRLSVLGIADCDPPPPIPNRLPRHDDDDVGVSFFRTSVQGDLSDLTLPRTFFGRSEISDARFRNADLHESNFCWNDFVDVDFSDSVLSGSDLRASQFERVSFIGANLGSADLRHSTFTQCKFDRASMAGTILTKRQGEGLSLSPAQISAINWVEDEGEEPEGG
jgi:BTB/POZ domain-containing protein KCTD9